MKIPTYHIKKAFSYVTGFNFGPVSLAVPPVMLNHDTAQKVILFLEDRRVLFGPTERQDYTYAKESVVQIRDFLNAQLAVVGPKNKVGQRLLAMRAASRDFLTTVDREGPSAEALDEYQQLMAEDIAELAVMFDLDVESELFDKLPGFNEALETS